jgi:glycosyltransferase involved in cell wall biosynthesis
MEIGITIAIPTLNSDQTLEWTLLSLKNQFDCRVRIIVVDSGSTDNTLELCKFFNVEVMYVEPGNMYRAINTGLERATTAWLGYLNSDDCVYLNSYSRLIEYGEKVSADIVYGGCDFIDNENRFIHSYTPAYPDELLSNLLSGQMGFAQPAAIFQKKVFQKLEGFNEEFTLAADLDFFLRAATTKFRFGYWSGPPVACFRVRQGQLSQNHTKMTDQITRIQANYDNPRFRYTVSLANWRLRNLPQYAVRILRRYQLSKKFQIAKTLDTYDYKDRE